MIGKRPRGRKRLGMLNEFLKESSYAELKRKAENRKEWRICMEAKNLPHGRTLTTSVNFLKFRVFDPPYLDVGHGFWPPLFRNATLEGLRRPKNKLVYIRTL